MLQVLYKVLRLFFLILYNSVANMDFELNIKSVYSPFPQ